MKKSDKNPPIHLYSSQKRILALAYKFRYLSAPLLARHKNVTVHAVYQNLKPLVEKGMLERKRDTSNILHHIPVRYFLTKKGINYIKQHFATSDKVLRSYYKNASLSTEFMLHCLAVHQAYLDIEATYPDTFDIFTKAEMAEFEEFPPELPDLYLQRKDEQPNKPDYFLELIDKPSMYLIKKRISAHVGHEDGGEWPYDEYPTVLLVCPDANTEHKVLKLLESNLDDIEFLTTTKRALSDSATRATWSDPVEPERLARL